MLLEKTVRVWHAYKGYLLFNAVVILLIAGISADMTGYVKRIPALDEIESAYFGSSYTSWLSRKNKEPESEYFHTEGLFTEEANIKAVTDLHRTLADNRYEERGRGEYIAYILKNGKSILRKYTVDEGAVPTLLKPLCESLEYKVDKYPVLRQEAGDIKLIEISDRRTSKKPLILSDGKLVQSFTDIMKQELIEADYEEVAEPEAVYVDISITDRRNFTKHYNFRRSFNALYKWLKDNGYYESALLLPEEIDHITVQTVKVTQDKGNISYTDTGGSMDLSDRAFLEELLDVYSYKSMAYSSGTYLRLDFYFQAEATKPGFSGYLSLEAPMSGALRQKLGKQGIDSGAAAE